MGLNYAVPTTSFSGKALGHRMIETKLLIKGQVALAGTLSTPETQGPHPLVICIHGSGPLDRNENSKHSKLNIFNAFAEFLAKQNIACFRYDKRGIGQSGGDYYSAGHSDLVDDAAAITRHFSDNPDVSQIYLLGHSEGTIIAPQVAQTLPVDGLILLAPFVTPLAEILEMQGAKMQASIDSDKGVSGWFMRLLTRAFGGVQAVNARLIKRVQNTDKPVIRQYFRKVEARWIREMLSLDPASTFKGITCPVLVLVARNDVQCPPEDGAKIAEIIGQNATLLAIPNLSHILRIETEETGFSGYSEQLKRPIAKEVLLAAGQWLGRQARD